MSKTSVTRVMDYLAEPELVNWFLNTPKAKRQAISEESLRIGTAVDELVRMDIQGEGYFVPLNEEAITKSMEAWEAFKKERPSFYASIVKKECQRELEIDGLLGHPDLILERDGAWGVVDIKTSKSIMPRYWTQTAQYS